MKISPNWIREFVSIPGDDRKLADDLTAAGMAVEKLYDDGTFEMEITTNRVDAMNHYGIAREASAIYDVDLKPLTSKLPAASGKSTVTITIDVPDYCARFTGREIRDVKIGPSASAVQQRFAELSQKPINSAADATNYVMLMMGKPTHAFDLDKLAGGKIIVRMARPGESLKTLDGVERKLHPEDVVVADAEKAVALAGVIGGWDSMITESTRNIFIESAWWDPGVIRKTSRRHGIHTDASHRFERGADWASCDISTDLVAQVIHGSGGGELIGEKVDVVARRVGGPPVMLRMTEVRRILGQEIPPAKIERMLKRLGFGISPQGKDVYTISIPTWRLDVEREIDVIEEIARLYGYNQFPNTLPAFAGGVVELPDAPKEDKVRRTLLALGYNEALSSTFIARQDSLRFSSETPVEIANPLSEEASAMRTSLVPGMLAMFAHNLNRGVDDVRLFEMGHTYVMKGAATEERPSLCYGLTVSALDAPDDTTAFRRFKGDLESLLSAFAGAPGFDSGAPEYFHPGRSAHVALDGLNVGTFGALAPHFIGELKLRQQIYIAEIALDRLYRRSLRDPRYQRLSRFPAVDRDFSFVFEDAVLYRQILAVISGLNIAELRSVRLAEIFRGGSVPSGRYSILLRMQFQSKDRTLTDAEVAACSSLIVEVLTRLGGTLRA